MTRFRAQQLPLPDIEKGRSSRLPLRDYLALFADPTYAATAPLDRLRQAATTNKDAEALLTRLEAQRVDR